MFFDDFCECNSFLSLDQAYTTYDTNVEDELESDPVARKRKAERLSEALAVLAIRPPSFQSLYTHMKLDQVMKNCSLKGS